MTPILQLTASSVQTDSSCLHLVALNAPLDVTNVQVALFATRPQQATTSSLKQMDKTVVSLCPALLLVPPVTKILNLVKLASLAIASMELSVSAILKSSSKLCLSVQELPLSLDKMTLQVIFLLVVSQKSIESTSPSA